MESESPIVKLKHDDLEGKRLHVLEIKVTDHMITEVTNLLKNYISTLIENIDKRFGDSLPVLTALSQSLILYGCQRKNMLVSAAMVKIK